MKSGFAVMIGRSNVGKSTLLNALVGTKVAITTPKPQTTRQPVQGVVTAEEGQAVFVDTPGIMQKARDPLTKKLLEYAEDSLKDIDVIMYVVDPTRPVGNEEKQAMKMIEAIDKPKLYVINKMDAKSAKRNLDTYRLLAERNEFTDIIEVSAKRGGNLDRLKRWIFEKLPEGEELYPDFQVTNMSKERQLAEIIREKLFLRLRKEVPYSVHVKVEEIDLRKDGMLYVKATIFTNAERYKSMIIGKGGRGIKEIGQSTRKELETITDGKVFLDLSVAVDRHWVEKM